MKELNANMLLQFVYHQPFDGTKNNGGLEGNIGLELPVYAWGHNVVLVDIGLGGGLFDMKRTGYKSSKVQGDQFPQIVDYNSFNLGVGLKF